LRYAALQHSNVCAEIPAKVRFVRKLQTNPKEDSMMFPNGVVRQSIPDNNSFFEVREIPENTVPQNCALLAIGEFQYVRDQVRTGSFLVRAVDLVFFIRVHSTRSGGSHAEVTLRSGVAPVTKMRVH
jgi:hypothetical protein